MWTIDFMNLVFGRGVEHDEFFNDVVYQEASIYYDFKIEDFKKHQVRMNALYYALIYQIGLSVTSYESRVPDNDRPRLSNDDKKKPSKGFVGEGETFFKQFLKDERPFGQFKPEPRYHFEILPKSKTFSLRNLPYSILAAKCKEFKDYGYINDAIQSCKMHSHIKYHLFDDELDTETQAELC